MRKSSKPEICKYVATNHTHLFIESEQSCSQLKMSKKRGTRLNKGDNEPLKTSRHGGNISCPLSKVDALLATAVDKGEGDIITRSKSSLQTTLNSEPLEVKILENRPMVANGQGMQMAEFLYNLEKRHKTLEQRHEDTVAQLEVLTEAFLKPSSSFYNYL